MCSGRHRLEASCHLSSEHCAVWLTRVRAFFCFFREIGSPEGSVLTPIDAWQPAWPRACSPSISDGSTKWVGVLQC